MWFLKMTMRVIEDSSGRAMSDELKLKIVNLLVELDRDLDLTPNLEARLHFLTYLDRIDLAGKTESEILETVMSAIVVAVKVSIDESVWISDFNESFGIWASAFCYYPPDKQSIPQPHLDKPSSRARETKLLGDLDNDTGLDIDHLSKLFLKHGDNELGNDFYKDTKESRDYLAKLKAEKNHSAELYGDFTNFTKLMRHYSTLYHHKLPPELVKLGLRKNKITGPRVAELIEKIRNQEGAQMAIWTANEFIDWAKQNNRHFNLKPIYQLVKDLRQQIDATTHRPSR